MRKKKTKNFPLRITNVSNSFILIFFFSFYALTVNEWAQLFLLVPNLFNVEFSKFWMFQRNMSLLNFQGNSFELHPRQSDDVIVHSVLYTIPMRMVEIAMIISLLLFSTLGYVFIAHREFCEQSKLTNLDSSRCKNWNY